VTPKFLKTHIYYFVAVCLLVSCSFKGATRSKKTDEKECQQFAAVAHRSLSSDLSAENCRNLSLYDFDVTIFTSESKLPNHESETDECLEAQGECVPVKVHFFNSSKAVESDSSNYSLYNYKEYRANLKDPLTTNQFLLTETGDTLEKAIESAIAACERRQP